MKGRDSTYQKQYRKYKKQQHNTRKVPWVSIVAIALLVCILVGGVIVLGPQLVHHCSNCDKLFIGTGYYANILSDTISTFTGNDAKLLCKDCAMQEHAIAITAGKSLKDFKRPLFGE